MKESTVRKRKSIVKSAIITILCFSVFSYFTNGMVLIGVPNAKDIQKVVIQSTQQTERVKELTGFEDIETARKLTRFLNYKFGKADEIEQPTLTMTFVKMDGSTVEVSANETTVWWKGKAHPLKRTEAFVVITRGQFF